MSGGETRGTTTTVTAYLLIHLVGWFGSGSRVNRATYDFPSSINQFDPVDSGAHAPDCSFLR